MTLAGAGFIIALGLLSILLSNRMHEQGHPFYITRKVAHLGAGVPIVLLPFVFQEMLYPLAIAIGFFLLLAVLKAAGWSSGFARKGRLSDVLFPLALVASIALFWNTDPFLAVVPGIWLAFGDGVTGLVRMAVNKREVKGWWGSLACFCVCTVSGFLLGVAMLPLLVASGLATLAERFSGDAEGSLIRLDDNLTMPATAILVFVILV